MRHLLYYSALLLVGIFWYRYGQKILRKGVRDENGHLNKGFFGPVGALVTAVITTVMGFVLLRALLRREISCIGKGCADQVYTMAAHASDYWANFAYLAWMVVALSYALYITVKLWMSE